MDGYYDHAPAVIPDRALAICGLPGSGVGAISREISLFTGLPWASLDRAVEHAAGVPLDALILRAGEDARLQHERELLPVLLRQSVPPVLGLGDTTLTDAGLVGALAGSRVVYLQRPRAWLYARLRARLAAKPAHRWSTLFGSLDERVLEPVFDAREAAMRAAATEVIDAGERDDRRVAWELAEGLGAG